jgi:hypothetical protein
MNLFRLSKISLVLTAVCVVSRFAEAQVSPVLTVTVGVNNIGGGEYVHRDKFGFDGFAGARWNPNARVSPLVGVYAGNLFDRFAHDAVCLVKKSGVGCVPTIPDFRYGGIAAGVAVRSRAASFGLLVGPGAYDAREWGSSTDLQPTVFGVLARGELYFHVVKHVEVGGSLASRMLPAFKHQRLYPNSFATGFRVSR